jgi:predicted carbohydrate-binding protein with CBM5 and CBM33 domain
MRPSRKMLLSAAAVAGVAASAAVAGVAFGHGYADDPASRQGRCAAGEVANCGPIQYEPQSVEGPKGFPAAGPADHQLCSAGIGNFAQLDDPRGGQWPAQQLSAGAQSFNWTLTAQHSTDNFEYYITNDSYDSAQPLTRADLEPEPIFSQDYNGEKPQASVTHEVTIPEGKSGRHLIYGVWNIADTANAFYSCIDVDIA